MASILSITNFYDKEQKRKNRFSLFFEDIPYFDGGDIGKSLVNSEDALGDAATTTTEVPLKKQLQLSVFSASRPDFSIGEQEFHRINEKYYYPTGKAEYQPMETAFYDTIDFNIGKILYAWMSAVYDVRTGAVGYKASFATRCHFLTLGPKGNVVERWILVNCWPKDVKYGEASYDSTDAMMVTVSFRYDLAIPIFYADGFDASNPAQKHYGYAGNSFSVPYANEFYDYEKNMPADEAIGYPSNFNITETDVPTGTTFNDNIIDTVPQ